jgi:hypothetical protein
MGGEAGSLVNHGKHESRWLDVGRETAIPGMKGCAVRGNSWLVGERIEIGFARDDWLY